MVTKDVKTIQCPKCQAVFERTAVNDKLRRYRDRRIMRTFHCPNCDARVILGKDDELLLERLERLKEQAKRLGDQQEVRELQDEIDRINRGIEMNAGKTKDKKFSVRGRASKTTDSLFKGQKVTAIKSEQGLREGETYTVLGEEEIIKQIVGENNITVYKLQDSSGNVIVIEGPCEGLFYEVKDSLIPVRQNMSSKEVEYKIGGQWKPIEGKVKAAYENEQIKYDRADGGYHYYTCEVKDVESEEKKTVPEKESESLKVKIGELQKNMDAARRMGYDTAPYQKEIDKLETKDDEGQVVISNKEIGKYNELKEKGYKTVWAGEGKICMKPSVRVKDEKFPVGSYVRVNMVGSKPEQVIKRDGTTVWTNKGTYHETKVVAVNDFYTKDPLTKKGQKILAAMKKVYGEEKGEQVFYASKNKGTIENVDKKTSDSLSDMDKKQLALGKKFKIVLPSGMGEPLYTNSFSAAVEMSKEYGKGTTVVDLTKATDSKTKDGSLDEMIRKMAREKADVPHNDDGTIRTPQQAQLAYEQWYKIIKSRYKNDSRYSAEYGDSKTKDDYKRMSLAELQRKAKEGYFEMQSDPKPRNHVEIKYPDGKKEWIFVEDSKTNDQEIKIIIGNDPVNPNPAEQKVEGNDILYKEYTLKQLPETGEFEIYSPGGTIIGHAKALELAKLFVDRIVASKIEG